MDDLKVHSYIQEHLVLNFNTFDKCLLFFRFPRFDFYRDLITFVFRDLIFTQKYTIYWTKILNNSYMIQN